MSIGNSGSSQYMIGIVVNNYYTDNSTYESIIVTVSQPIGSGFITGGGFLVNGSSAGQYAADSGQKTNFGFNVKYNKQLTNLQGNANIIFRRGGHVYQIKTNAMNTLAVQNNCQPSGVQTAWSCATFTSKANLADVTNPNAPVALGGNLSLVVNITDKGEPGSSDTISIQLMSGNALLFSSNWNGTQTIQQILTGGNLVVH
jgi:hypothetical protein